MNRVLLGSSQALMLMLLLASPAFPQTKSPSPSGGGGTPSGGNANPQPSGPQSEQNRNPVILTGRILSDLERPITDAASLQLVCGLRTVQSVHADLDGNFIFDVGGGSQSNVDFSAANGDSQSFGATAASQFGVPTRYGENILAGCEVHISAPGFYPVTRTMTEPAAMGRLDLGTFHLSRVGGANRADISVAELKIPKDAKNEYQKGLKEAQNGKPEAAVPHFEKAVAIYNTYPSAWNDLGRAYELTGNKDKAVMAYQKAIDNNPQYVPPLLSLAALQIQDRNWKDGTRNAERVAELDSSIGYAHFLAAVGNYNLHNLEEAEHNAEAAAKDPATDASQLDALFADIYLQKQDYPQAMSHMRAYLAESPNGPYSAQIKKNLANVQQQLGEAGGQ